MPCFHIHISGIVQGVGFRPRVYQIARKMDLKGSVSNGPDGVDIEFFAEKGEEDKILTAFLNNKPSRAMVSGFRMNDVDERAFTSFSIIESSGSGNFTVRLTPDLGMCEDCEKDIYDTVNRRFNYPFTTCLNCGPRYSIINKLPYDRPFTSMYKFKMCPACEMEYNDPENRRHYSQTNSCPNCAIPVKLIDRQGNVISTEWDKILGITIAMLHEGKILAVKGIGGYMLMCDAGNRDAITELRHRKNRPDKPFALMYPDLEKVKSDTNISPEEQEELLSIERPIVLLDVKKDAQSRVDFEVTAPGLSNVGIMLPYTPMHSMIMAAWGEPLIATSANLSGSPLYYDDEKALNELAGITDFFINNDREILVPQDDSVVRFSRKHNQRIMIRRSRGYAPNYMNPDIEFFPGTLAMGAMMKSAFAFTHGRNVYISQYLGDQQNYETGVCFNKTLQHLTGITGFKARHVLCDLHPDYYSSVLGYELKESLNIPLHRVQHHEAHFMAVLAENDLLECKESILGVVWDGAGLGADNNIWGGEFFLYSEGDLERYTHFEPFPNLAGDKMALQPRLSALAIGHKLPGAVKLLREKFTATEWDVYKKLLEGGRTVNNSSAGRLFDAVACLLGLADFISYEGQAAMLLEQVAGEDYYMDDNFSSSYVGSESLDQLLKPENLLGHVIADKVKGHSNSEIAAKFHMTLVKIIEMIAQRSGVHRIAFSGGVFQNGLLLDMIIDVLDENFDIYLHQELSPNDECIAFGQLAHHSTIGER